MASRSCLLTLLDDGWLRVEFTYSAEAVEALKRRVPHQDREWHEVGKFWRGKGTHEAWLVHFAKSYPVAMVPRAAIMCHRCSYVPCCAPISCSSAIRFRPCPRAVNAASLWRRASGG